MTVKTTIQARLKPIIVNIYMLCCSGLILLIKTTIFLSTSDNCKAHLKYFNILPADFLSEQAHDLVKDKPQKALMQQ